jgi:predicted nucleic acid-binding protein
LTLRIVCDASALAAALLDAGVDGRWAADAVSGADLAAPSLLAFETSNVVRRLEIAGGIGADQAAQAHADLLDLTIEQWPYEVLATRCRELRRNVSIYDASYVALAELIDAPLVTLDARLARSPGIKCETITP